LTLLILVVSSLCIAVSDAFPGETAVVVDSKAQSLLDKNQAVTAPVGEQVFTLEPLVVTAEKMDITLEKVPASVSVLTQNELKDRGIVTVEEASRTIPNLYIFAEGSGGRDSYVYIRGIGATNNEPAIAFLVDGVGYSSEGLFDIDLTDVEQIEVLRGPQGTLYGKNAAGGVINVTTKDPGPIAEGDIKVTLADYDRQRYEASWRGPWVENRLFFGISGSMETKNEGYQTYALTGHDADSLDEWTGRAKLRWLAESGPEVTFSVDRQVQNDSAFNMAPSNELDNDNKWINNNAEGWNHKVADGISMKINHHLPWGELTSITAARNWDNELFYDVDYSSLDFVSADLIEDKAQISQETQLIYSPEGENGWQLQLGGFLERIHFDRDVMGHYGTDASVIGLAGVNKHWLSEQKDDQHALFGQLTLPIGNRLTLKTGIRYSHEKKRMELDRWSDTSGNLVAGSTNRTDRANNFEEWLPRFALIWKLDEDITLFSNIARGYRSGGFNWYHQNDADASFESETNWNYEVGVKSNWFDRRLYGELSLFLLKTHNLQLEQLQTDGSPIYLNGGKAGSRGVELTMKAVLPKGWEVDSSYGYTDSRFLQYIDQSTGTDYAGYRTPMTPRHTLNTALNNRTQIDESGKLTLFSQGEMQVIGNVVWDTASQYAQTPYGLFNFHLGLESDSGWLAKVWVKNILDKEYDHYVIAPAGLGPRTIQGPPRTMGLTLSYLF